MKGRMLSSIVAVFCALRIADGLPFGHNAQVVGRDTELRRSYDFVVVGGGASGLTVADRLTENPETTVLVIEYGPFDQGEPSVLVPGLLDLDNTPYAFNLTSTPIPGLNNRTSSIPAAAVVGGGTVINGLFFDRGSAADYDAWEELGNPGWGWDDLLPYFRKSETFTPANEEVSEEYSISWDVTVHGTSGPVQASYPVFLYESIMDSENFISGWHDLGISTPVDPNGGDAYGVFWAPGSLDPKDETRSYARTAHYDRVIDGRPNYHILTDNAVLKAIFEEDRAVGVDYIDRETKEVHSIEAAREVIVAAGAVHTPQILQLSGIGPKDLLESFDIETIVDLPGVGQNFQDHPTLYLNYDFQSNIVPNADTLETNETWAAEQLALYWEKREGAYTQIHQGGNTVAFLPMPNLTSNYQDIIDRSASQFESNDKDPVAIGYQAQREIILRHYSSTTSSVAEWGWSTSSTVVITNVKPLSRGSILINGTEPLTPPLVNYNTFSDPTDIDILIAGVRKNRELMDTPAMQELTPIELVPGLNVTTDEQIIEVLREQGVPTYSHLAGTCAMMKREMGGVVDTELRVYGTRGLRVVDASMMPITPATHTSSTVYAVAEKAADIIKAHHHLL
ncbi:hypothetical protein FQN54_001481 [Arachnomyces sp. PD_36]|nr:hypothetical protein FQN54_001481 [Arachnomyces sp. PD_36]